MIEGTEMTEVVAIMSPDLEKMPSYIAKMDAGNRMTVDVARVILFVEMMA